MNIIPPNIFILSYSIELAKYTFCAEQNRSEGFSPNGVLRNPNRQKALIITALAVTLH